MGRNQVNKGVKNKRKLVSSKIDSTPSGKKQKKTEANNFAEQRMDAIASSSKQIENSTNFQNKISDNNNNARPVQSLIQPSTTGISSASKCKTRSKTRSHKTMTGDEVDLLINPDQLAELDKDQDIMQDNIPVQVEANDGIETNNDASEEDYESDEDEDVSYDGQSVDEEMETEQNEQTEQNDGIIPMESRPTYPDIHETPRSVAPSVNSEVQFRIHKRPAPSEDNHDQVVNHMINELVEERVKRRLIEEKVEQLNRQLEAATPQQKKDTTVRDKQSKTPMQRLDEHKNNTTGNSVIKSPSDTTIYAPALVRGNNDNCEVIEKIANFVESIRFSEKSKSRKSTDVTTSTPTRQEEVRHVEKAPEPEKLIDNIIVEAEKYKANVAAPQGRDTFNLSDHFRNELEMKRFFDSDDDFFHVSCHIEPGLREKIVKGEFIDLERLLPKDKFMRGVPTQDCLDGSSRIPIDVVTRSGHTYLAPSSSERDAKINGIRKWEQAFRVYAAIYSDAHPDRSSEIWQYIYTINLAATSHSWESVAFYDYTFRQLMAAKPWRSWSKTYAQGWNLALKGDNGKKTGNVNMPVSYGSSKPSTSSGRDWKDDCCWRYGKNKCNKSSRDCDYDHRCTFCGVWNHSYNDCNKRKRSAERRSYGNGGNYRGNSGNSGNSGGSYSDRSFNNRTTQSNNSNYTRSNTNSKNSTPQSSASTTSSKN